jgi:lipoate-protein ligase A
MSDPLRVIGTGERAARWNVAMTAALADLHHAGALEDTLRFHRYPASVLIGRHQVLSQAAHVDRCAAGGVELARRMSGGGAVYMAPGALAWDLVIARRRVDTDLTRAAAAIGEALAAGLMLLDLPARYDARIGITIDGRKLCGLSGYFDGGTLVSQGTILIDTDLSGMRRFLKSPMPGVEMVTVRRILGRAPDAGEIEAALACGLAQALDRPLRRQEPDAAELRCADERHAAECGRDSFVHDPAWSQDAHTNRRAAS